MKKVEYIESQKIKKDIEELEKDGFGSKNSHINNPIRANLEKFLKAKSKISIKKDFL